MDSNGILIGRDITTDAGGPVTLLPRFGNRHGLVAGATGTGKTVSLLVLAEGFSRLGVPVFMADVKGDVAGIAMPGTASDKLSARAAQVGAGQWHAEASPVVFWDIHGVAGHPLRATVSEMGPTLLARILELNDTQEGVLEIAFKIADDDGLLLLDLADLRALLTFCADNRTELSAKYGLISTASIGAIQRGLLQIERQGGDRFFGEPALELTDFLRQDLSGRGIVNVLAADQLVLQPKLYSTFLLWLLSELFERLPEVGDLELPKLVFFFDEAHLLFDDATPALKQRIEQVVRLIRSKGVGIYFCSQFPDDIPDNILGQLGNRVQHALRAFTPRDQKAVQVAAQTFAPNPALDVATTIAQLGVGEALVSTLQGNGVPMPVARTLIAPPGCRMGAISADERATIRARSPLGSKYDTTIDRESAAELLAQRHAQPGDAAPSAIPTPASAGGATAAAKPAASAGGGAGQTVKDWVFGTSRRQGMIETMAKQTARTIGSQVGRQILRGVLGGIFGSRR